MDAYVKTEGCRLYYIRNNQAKLRVDGKMGHVRRNFRKNLEIRQMKMLMDTLHIDEEIMAEL